MDSATPFESTLGSQLDVNISGTNFQSGATVEFVESEIIVNATDVQDCNSIVIDVTVGSTAALGAAPFRVINPNDVAGVANELFYAGVDPNEMRLNRVGCFDVGVKCGGWGRIVLEVKMEERR